MMVPINGATMMATEISTVDLPAEAIQIPIKRARIKATAIAQRAVTILIHAILIPKAKEVVPLELFANGSTAILRVEAIINALSFLVQIVAARAVTNAALLE